MKGKLEGKIMKEFIELKAKTCIYSADDNDETKKAKDKKKCVTKRNLKFDDYLNKVNKQLQIKYLNSNENFLRSNIIIIVKVT